MTSSSSYDNAQALPTVTPRSGKVRVSPDQAAALMAQHQPQPRVRYLGVAYPGGQQSGLGQSATGFQTGQYQNPALVTDGRLTVNSSISSAPVPAITDGGGSGGGGGVAVSAITSSAVAGGTNTGFTTGGTAINGNATINGAAAPAFAPTSAAGLSPLGASSGARLPLGTTATAVTPTTSPTAFSARNPDPTISSFPALAAANGATRTNAGTALGAGAIGNNSANTNATIANNNAAIASDNFSNNPNFNNNTTTSRTGTTANATARATTTNATGGTATGRISPVRVTRDANGRAVISNTTTSRNQ